MLVDSAIIEVRSGKGGDGALSFRREAYIAKGGPDGGDGGHGGSVILQATIGVDTLLDMNNRYHWYAKDGQPGMGRNMTGKTSEDMIVRVPLGTMVYDEETGELLADLDEADKQVVVAQGGRGGRGNDAFKSATNQTPREFEHGEPGVEHLLRLELKLIADVGLVGKPNAGKSTLLSRITAARPKTADYPFTTLHPVLGIVDLDRDRRMTFADIPGLIEGASEGAGLGHEFLKHIERTWMLVHVIEIDPSDRSDPVENYKKIRDELAAYSPVLAEKTNIVALNKIDLLTEEDQKVAIELVEDAIQRPVIPISAASGKGLKDLAEKCWQILRTEKDNG